MSLKFGKSVRTFDWNPKLECNKTQLWFTDGQSKYIHGKNRLNAINTKICQRESEKSELSPEPKIIGIGAIFLKIGQFEILPNSPNFHSETYYNLNDWISQLLDHFWSKIWMRFLPNSIPNFKTTVLQDYLKLAGDFWHAFRARAKVFFFRHLNATSRSTGSILPITSKYRL